MLALPSRGLMVLGISGILAACTQASSSSSITLDGTLSSATFTQSKAEVAALLRKELEHSCTFGAVELGLDVQIKKTSSPGRYQFDADYYERLSHNNAVMAYTAKGTCDMASKKVKLTSLTPKYSTR